MKRLSTGFTLIELMITVSIIAILAAVAYPSYVKQVLRSHRAEGRDALLQVQLAQEKYFLSNNSFTTLANLNVPDIKLNGSNYDTANGYYRVTVTVGTGTTPSYTAIAANNIVTGQFADGHCAQFSVTDTGDKSGTTNADCWTK